MCPYLKNKKDTNKIENQVKHMENNECSSYIENNISPNWVKTKTIKLVFAASPLSM